MTPTTPDAPATAWLARSRATLARTDLAPHAETVGRVEHVADGIALVSGLPDVRPERAAALRRRTLRLCAHPRRRHDRRGAARRRRRDRRRLAASRERGRWCRCRSGRACSDASSIRSAGRSIATSRCTADGAPADRTAGAGHHRARSRRRADCDRHSADRRVVRDRARPTRADHRRPRDRQDRDRARHDRQPESSRT